MFYDITAKYIQNKHAHTNKNSNILITTFNIRPKDLAIISCYAPKIFRLYLWFAMTWKYSNWRGELDGSVSGVNLILNSMILTVCSVHDTWKYYVHDTWKYYAWKYNVRDTWNT